MKVKIIDPQHPCFGQELEGGIIYFDYYHRGGRPDLYQVKTPEGKIYRLLTDQIDEDHYEAQEVAREIERIGAKVGDTVLITRLGSGGSKAGFDFSVPHVITKIDGSGHVEFDDRAAYGFRPDVQVVSQGGGKGE
ncbi:hypothetical protein EJ573_03010 [Paenibacillus polymyxa]|uniref:hypothetical protein n=1 Tax=Paenibacillus polymyxa TaxID=1406 RepID=UPI000F87A00B|nr:hypothetical protein [Paenibacillus polymyxa]RTZ38186.1 hypothetical protein EJ573_03010 [Paenibacillus polymyxa]